MSVTTVVDVWCDHPGCTEWADGVTRRNGPVSVNDARRVARGRGWTRRKVDGQMRDLCPSHSTYTAADRAFLAQAVADHAATPTVSVFEMSKGLHDEPTEVADDE